MVSKNLLAEYGQASIELEIAQTRYNQIRVEIEKQIQADQEQAKQEQAKQVPDLELEPKQEQKPKNK
ncbi:MAG: hypothetical protein PHN69_02580 [Candidatus Pacebacteria bacterium]|nr:hypothetical protein [Candidatus Paceibacterota bacterium]